MSLTQVRLASMLDYVQGGYRVTINQATFVADRYLYAIQLSCMTDPWVFFLVLSVQHAEDPLN